MPICFFFCEQIQNSSHPFKNVKSSPLSTSSGGRAASFLTRVGIIAAEMCVMPDFSSAALHSSYYYYTYVGYNKRSLH